MNFFDGRIRVLFFVTALCVLSSSRAFAAEERFGVLYPEQKQLQEAILGATELGRDIDVDEPVSKVNLEAASLAVGDGRESAIEELVVESLKPVTLEEEIQDQTISEALEQFGYDIFSNVPSTFAPTDSISVPPDYTIGPGDSFLLQMFSGVDLQYSLTVTREGRLLVPEIGDIQVAGLTFEEVKSLVKESISKSRLGVKVVLTLAKLSSIQIMIVGEVVQPGTYTVSGLSSLVNTLVSTGAVKRTGTLRDIQVKRQGKVVARFDLYDLLLRGDTRGNIYLRQGDVIFVPPIGQVVSIAGEVVRPAIYELTEEETVSEVVRLAGGFLASADLSKTQIERVGGSDGYLLIQAGDGADFSSMPISNGDIIRVFPVRDKVQNVVVLGGNVSTPGGFEWRPGMTLRDLIPNREFLLQGTDLSVAAIERENRETKKNYIYYFDLERALAPSRESDRVSLNPRDRIIIFRTDKARSAELASVVRKINEQTDARKLPSTFEIIGAVRHEGQYPLQKDMRVLDALLLSGGIKPGVDRHFSLLSRTDPKTREIEFIRLELDAALAAPRGDHNPVIQEQDRIYIFDNSTYRPELLAGEIEKLRRQSRQGRPPLVVEVSGGVKQPGAYPLIPGMRVSGLIEAAGGLHIDAYSSAVTLSRTILLDGEYSKLETLDISLQANSNSVMDGINTILEPRDHLVIRSKPEWSEKLRKVTIEGEVAYPGTYSVDKRMTLCGLVSTAGGFTQDAYLFGAVFTRNSIRRREQDAIDRIQRQMGSLLTDVHMSPGLNKDSKLPTNQSTLDTFRVIQNLKPESAVGRMVIDLERAAVRCDEQFDIVLEDGDKLFVPKYLDEVSVVGQVYFPQSHQFREDRAALDYINLSGGTKELAQREHAYVVQANGEILSVRSPASTWGWLLSPSNVRVTPGSTIYVPLSVDRINGREFTESWIDLVYKLTLSAASVDFLFGGN